MASYYQRISSWFRRHVTPDSSPELPPTTSPIGAIGIVPEEEAPWLREQLAWDLAGGAYRRESALSASLTGETAEMRLAYRRMLAEPTVKAAFLGKLGSVASLDLTVLPPEGEEDNPLAKEIALFTQANLVGSSGTAYELVWEIGHGGLLDGYSVAEKLWRIQRNGRWHGRWWFDRLKSKDTQFLTLDTDQYRNVVGIRNLRAGQSTIPFDPADFVVFSYLPLFSNPYGMSDFRAVYRTVELIVASLKLRSLMLSKFTGPFLKGTYTNPLARNDVIKGLREARAMGYVAVLEGSEVEVIDLATKGTADFQSAIDDLRKEVAIGIQGAFLQMLEGTASNLRGSSVVQKETSEVFAWLLSVMIAACINRQLVPDIVLPNYGATAPLPLVKLGAIDPSEILVDLQVDQLLSSIGVSLSARDLYRRSGRKPPLNAADTIPPAPAQTLSSTPARGLPGQTFAEDPKRVAVLDDGEVDEILAEAQRQGTETLGQIMHAAVSRILAGEQDPHTLFTAQELTSYAEALAATLTPADLLGRSSIRKIMVDPDADPVPSHEVRTFAESPIALAPERAVEYFLSLVPTLSIEPRSCVDQMRRQAFTLAVASEQTLLERVQRAIADQIQQGQGAAAGGRAVQDILDAVGVSPKNPQYSEMVFRTNSMDSYNRAAQEEMQDPDVMDYFPVWQYLGIRDGRQGEDHEPHFDKYFPNTATFEEVRGPRIFNCRCAFRPVGRKEWADLQAKGARMESTWMVR